MTDEIEFEITPEEEPAVEEPVEVKPKRSRKSTKKVVPYQPPVPLESIDRNLDGNLGRRPVAVDARPEPIVAEKDISGFAEDVVIVNGARAEKSLRNTASRTKSVADKVAYLAEQPRQKYFGLLLASWMVRTGGVFYVPEELADYFEGLQEGWGRESEAPSGFVAFRAQ